MPRMLRPFCQYTKRNPFSPSFYIKHAECTPITVICAFVMSFMTFCSIRTFFNTDVVATRNMKSPGERTELLLHPRHRKVRERLETCVEKQSINTLPVHVYTLVMWGAVVAAAQAGYHGGD